MDERREGFRCDLELSVQVGDSIGRVCNLSMGGMMCFLDSKVPSMEQLPITFKIDDFVISIKGTVLRCEEITRGNFSTGIYFNTSSINDVQRNKLSIFLDKLRLIQSKGD